MTTREQLEALRIKFHERAEEARDEAMIGSAFDSQYYLGKRDAFAAAASHVLTLIESQEEVTA